MLKTWWHEGRRVPFVTPRSIIILSCQTIIELQPHLRNLEGSAHLPLSLSPAPSELWLSQRWLFFFLVILWRTNRTVLETAALSVLTILPHVCAPPTPTQPRGKAEMPPLHNAGHGQPWRLNQLPCPRALPLLPWGIVLSCPLTSPGQWDISRTTMSFLLHSCASVSTMKCQWLPLHGLLGGCHGLLHSTS